MGAGILLGESLKPKGDKRYDVPDAMLEAVKKAAEARGRFCMYSREDLEEAVRWIAENPIVPTEKQFQDMARATWPISTYTPTVEMARWSKATVIEWQRRMFLAVEPKIGDNALNLKDKLQGIVLTPEEAEMLVGQIRIRTFWEKI